MKILFVSSLLIILILFLSGCLKPVKFEGTSMIPAIKDGDRLFINYNFGELQRGDIVSFLYPKDTTKWYMKRIIGLPGEKIEIMNGAVFVNDKKLEEDYVDEEYNSSGTDFSPRIIPEGEYYVLGDNRDNSSDSRYWGTVKKDLIQGKYYTTYYQPDKK